MTGWTYGAWAFAAGVLIPVMAALNGGLARAIGSTAWAAVVPFAVGLVATLAVAGAGGSGPSLGMFRDARPEQFAGGLIVAFYAITVTHLAPRFGVGPTILCVVVAQIVTATLIGHFGWLGAPVQRIDAVRAAGVALLLAGLFLTQLRRA